MQIPVRPKRKHVATGKKPSGRPRKVRPPLLGAVQTTDIDPRAILRAIAADAAQPAAARVAACKALLVDAKEPVGNPIKARAGLLTERALAMLGGLEDGNSPEERPN